MKWEDLVAPAITLADEGFILDEGLPSSIAEGRRFLDKWPEAAKIYLPNGKVPRPGDRFFNKDYATTLRAIQKGGADAFYKGEIAKKIAADMEENGGILTFADLAQYRAIERAPVAGHYRGHTLYAGGPPLSTGIQLFESLHVLENYQPKPGARASTDPDYLHYLMESWKVRDPLRRVADPERWPVEFEEHLTDAHAKTLFAKIDAKKAMRYERTPPDDAPATPTAPTPRISTGTTSFAVADADGNMIAVTQTLEHVGRHLLRVEGPRLPLQQSPAIESPDRRRVRQPRAADAIVDVGGADAGVREEGRPVKKCRGSRWAAPATRGSRCRSTTSSPA